MTAASVTITVQNLTTPGVLAEDDFQAIVAALNHQVTQDYGTSCWVMQGLAAPATVIAVAAGETPPPDSWHVELLDTSDQEGALGYHEDEAFDNKLEGVAHDFAGPTAHPRKASARSSRGLRADNPELPLAKVFVKTAQQDNVQPGEVASHEVLEMLVDPQVVKSVRTVVNTATKQKVIVEVGDPVQDCGYKIGDVEVADFALPAWFGIEQTANPTQMSFRSSVQKAFELAPGGYISVAPEGTEDWTQIFGSASGQ